MTSAVLSSPDVSYVGDALTALVPSGSLYLPVENAGEFEEEPTSAFLVVGSESEPHEYVEVENDDDADQQWVKLAAPTTVAYESGLPVSIWDPASEAMDKRTPRFTAMAAVDDQPLEPFPVRIPHTLIPSAGLWTLDGARVTLEESEAFGWQVANVTSRSPSVSSDYLALPYVSAVLPANLTVPTAGLLTIDTWEVSEVRSFEYDPSTGIFRFLEDGMYRALFGATYESNPSGNRRIVPRKHFRDGTDQAARAVQVGANVGVSTAFEVTVPEQRFWAGEGLSFETSQSSGGDLMLLGSTGVRSRPTEVTISRVAP